MASNFVDKFKIDNSSLSIQEEHNNLKDVKCLLIGNSYNAGTGSSNNRGWGYYFTQITQCDSLIVGQNGGDFAAVGNENSTYPNRTYPEILDLLNSDLSQEEREKYKYIIVGGGWNDGSSSRNPGGLATTRNNISSFCTKARNYFPNASIWIIPIGNVEGFPEMSYYTNIQAWVEYSINNGVHTTDMAISTNYGWSDYSAGDGIHLNDDGYRHVGRLIASVIDGNYSNVEIFPRAITSDYTNTTRTIIQGMIVNFYSTITVNENLSAQTVLFTMHPTIRPKRTIYDECFMFGASGSRYVIPIAFFATGEVQLRNSNDTIPANGTIYINSSYMRMLP